MTLTVNIAKRLEHFELQTDFTCPAGELTALIGPSGAGKTTILRVIAGLEASDSGVVSLNGTCWYDSWCDHFIPTQQRRIGLVFQEYALFPHMTVRQNIAFGAPDSAEVDTLMEIFGIKHLSWRKPRAISGGERQRAAFCQALARKPDLLLLDEPFSALDVQTRTFLCALLGEYKSELGIPILHVTHDLKEAELLADTVIAVDKGRIAPDWLGRQPIVESLPMPIPTYS